MLITNSAAVADFCSEVSTAEYVAVDTEFVREKTYWPILCLVQIATPDQAVAIDPLANDIDLQPVYDLMTNTSVLKVFHSASQDMQVMFNATGRMTEPVFDTQIASCEQQLGKRCRVKAVSAVNCIESLVARN